MFSGNVTHAFSSRLSSFRKRQSVLLAMRSRFRPRGWEFLDAVVDEAWRPAYVEVLPDQTGSTAAAFLRRTVRWFARRGVVVRKVSPWYRTAPVPASDQPWYVNAVAEVGTGLVADALLAQIMACPSFLPVGPIQHERA